MSKHQLQDTRPAEFGASGAEADWAAFRVTHLQERLTMLRQLRDGPIRVIPFMRIDGKRVVPRLEFTINLVAALPPTVAAPLRQAAGACALSVRESGWSLQALQGRRKCAPVGSADGPL